MQYSFRLAELLDHVPDPNKRPGTIKAIVDFTGLDRHQVAALLKNEVKYIPLKALSRLCDYLIQHGHATAEELPGALFAVEAENFWELLARRKRLELCVGVRQDVGQPNPDIAFVVASDSVLLGELLNGVTTLGGTALVTPEKQKGDKEQADIPHPETLKQSLVWSPGQLTPEKVKQRAEKIYRDFSETSGDKALVCLGSTKSNPVSEYVIARAFGCNAFQSDDRIQKASERQVPFFIRFRDSDPQPDSCFGGTVLSKTDKVAKAGIYYEESDGSWTCCESSEEQQVALVFYIHRESQGRLEMVLAGFSGTATRLLARALANRSQDFWDAKFQGQGMKIGCLHRSI